MAGKALVTIAFGEPYESWWREVARPTWEEYAARYGYEVIAFHESLDRSGRGSSRSPSWQKCLLAGLPELRGFDRIVCMDCDIAIHPDLAPDIAAVTPEEQIGGVSSLSPPALPPGTFPDTYYTDWGLPADLGEVVNCGMLVVSPRRHSWLLRKTYDEHEDRGGSEWHYEQRPLSYGIITNRLLHRLDRRFNRTLALDVEQCYPFLRHIPVEGNERVIRMCIQSIFCRNYFTHFAGYHRFMRFLDPAIRRFDEFGGIRSAVDGHQ